MRIFIRDHYDPQPVHLCLLDRLERICINRSMTLSSSLSDDVHVFFLVLQDFAWIPIMNFAAASEFLSAITSSSTDPFLVCTVTVCLARIASVDQGSRSDPEHSA